MSRLVILSLGAGNLQTGFNAVSAQLWDCQYSHPLKIAGRLPPAPEIIELYRAWQLLYTALYESLNWQLRIELKASGVTNVSEIEFYQVCQRLKDQLNVWLNSESFQSIDRQLRTQLHPSEEVRVIVETEELLLWRIPWHLWNFFEDYPHAEIALSTLEYQPVNCALTRTAGSKVRILAIFGNGRGLELDQDRIFLEQLSAQAETRFLVEPQAQELNDQLWEHGWEILFFAGHSWSQTNVTVSGSQQGILQLNAHHSLTLDQLRYALKKAIANGLKLAIFNSCDGLGLAQDLADLHIPQVIVMREAVPDRVAQVFLKHFLAAFSGGQSLYTSVRIARERLQRFEDKFPCATWLPVLYQNPAETPPTWQALLGWHDPNRSTPDQSVLIDPSKREPAKGTQRRQLLQPFASQRADQKPIQAVFLISFLSTLFVIGVRLVGLLQPLELMAFDQLQKVRPQEPSDDRLLVIGVTEAEIRAQSERKGSLSDPALARLLEKLEQYQPRVIGLDIYRDFAVDPNYPELATRLRQHHHLVAVCKSRDSDLDPDGVAPPPEVAPERLSFSDFVEDPDGVLRRHLLTLTPDPASVCKARYAFSTLLALQYLAAEGIFPQFTPEGNLQLRDTVFHRLQPGMGAYQQVDTRGNQILLNYRSSYSPQKVAAQVTLSQVLNDRVDPSLVKDRIVLIGTVASSTQDDWITPYGLGPEARIPGVLAQAQMVSQILSAVLDRRPLLRFWPAWAETLWIWTWACVGGMLVCSIVVPLRLWVAGGVAIAILPLVCFGLLVQGIWVPLVPTVLVLLLTGGGVKVYQQSFQTTALLHS